MKEILICPTDFSSSAIMEPPGLFTEIDYNHWLSAFQY